MLTLARRAQVRQTPTALIRSWRSLDGRFVVAEVSSLLGLPKRVLAIQRLENGNELVVSRHRKRHMAVKALARLGR